MASLGIWAVRVLRRLPHTAAFDAHLTRCAFAETLWDENLTLFKVLGWSRIECGIGEGNSGHKAIEAAMLASGFAEDAHGGVIGKPIHFQDGTQTIH